MNFKKLGIFILKWMAFASLAIFIHKADAQGKERWIEMAERLFSQSNKTLSAHDVAPLRIRR